MTQQPSTLRFLQEVDSVVLQGPLGNPFYYWPRTLLSYPVEGDRPTSATSHTLHCVETGTAVPFQISKSVTAASDSAAQTSILFLSDLPAGATRTYRLLAQPSPNPESGLKPVTIKSEGRRLTIDTGVMQIRIPASQEVRGEAPGPILEICRGGNWTGVSKLTISGHPVRRIDTEQLEDGPLRSSHRITYTLGPSTRYVATVECIAGMDFVRLHEDMETLPSAAIGKFDFAWTGRDLSYRQGPNHPYNFPRQAAAEYAQYPWEKIAPTQMDTQFGVSPGIDPTGKLPFSLRLFDPWSDPLAASFANFWGDNSADAAAIFIDHIEQWEDHEYAIWHSSARLAVEFVYTKPTLHFVWKIARGTRSTCLGFYDHGKDIALMKTLENQAKGFESDGVMYRTGLFPTSHALELQNWYGTLDLNKVKDWFISYPASAALPKPLFTNAPHKNAGELYHSITQSDFVNQLAISGVRQNHGFGPTSSRQILESWIPGYQIYRSQLSQAQRQRVESVLLLLAYVHAGEDYMPMRPMLAGHPNFLSDVKSTPCGMAFLFPEHPDADSWADEFEAFLSLNTRYHTRPAVDAWGARGGRWTENLGTYVWAFLRPASRGAFLLRCRDGHERLCGPQLAELGDWLVNALSAPFAGESQAVMKQIEEESAGDEGARRHYWGIVDPVGPPRRVHPPLGAHSERRKTPRTMWYLGAALRNYTPLTAEHIMWAARPNDQDMEATADQGDPYDVMYSEADNRGTNPHLRSTKYTGYGITLRAAVDTPQELSIHLLQIDAGPNYRWGAAGEGSCGMIYFYANGKGYSHNGVEDAGDRVDQDTDFCTNFGVWKSGTFRSIGQNVLSSPLYSLSTAQFAQIVPRNGREAYSWPEYVSRSILLAGEDYFVIYDHVFNPEVAHRFSWFVRKGDDFPHISLLPRAGVFSSVETTTTAGRWADGLGDSLALITHKDGIRAEHAPFGARVSLTDGADLVFLAPDLIRFQEGKKAFIGTSGIIRDRKEGFSVALFHGTHIAAAGLSLTTSDTDLGISATIANDGTIRGSYFAPLASELEIGLAAHLTGLLFYLDGGCASGGGMKDRLVVKLPAGMHQWELAAGPPTPLAPRVDRTEYTRGGAIVYGVSVASATAYALELSADNSQTWAKAGTSSKPVFTLTGLTLGKKYHVRFVARNAVHESAPGLEYPLYITEEAPAVPDGLRVELSALEAQLTWGEVLGVTEYRLYRRTPLKPDFVVAYAGRLTKWKDVDSTIAPSVPSLAVGTTASKEVLSGFEYYVTAVNHIGESRASRKANTNPASWRNWNPTQAEPFRRTVERMEGLPRIDNEGRYYPK